jgi:pantoate--beta-alanine ligase
MRIVTSIPDMHRIADAERAAGKRIGFVPTMGFLHAGHMSLLHAARARCSTVVMSIFVNPIQFGPAEDFARYPRDEARDLAMAEEHGCDIVFLPSREDMYPDGFETSVDLNRSTIPLEGESRPGHFRGVATVVAKLFNIVKPHMAVFGQKDAQQAIVIRRMTRDLNMDVEIVVAPIVREPDGLAMSSRNAYLSTEERTEALAISRSLRLAESMCAGGIRDPQRIADTVGDAIRSSGRVSVEYARLVDAETFEDAPAMAGDRPALLVVAARVGSTRLIDNTILSWKDTI